MRMLLCVCESKYVYVHCNAVREGNDLWPRRSFIEVVLTRSMDLPLYADIRKMENFHYLHDKL